MSEADLRDELSKIEAEPLLPIEKTLIGWSLAPTYLVFFQLAGGDPTELMDPLAKTLAAISLGAVFMGANTYIGNAPNFMVYAIARRAGVKMPSFFGYMVWSGAILIPLFAVVTWLFIYDHSPVPLIANR
jgi:hypothetical protein